MQLVCAIHVSVSNADIRTHIHTHTQIRTHTRVSTGVVCGCTDLYQQVDIQDTYVCTHAWKFVRAVTKQERPNLDIVQMKGLGYFMSRHSVRQILQTKNRAYNQLWDLFKFLFAFYLQNLHVSDQIMSSSGCVALAHGFEKRLNQVPVLHIK